MTDAATGQVAAPQRAGTPAPLPACVVPLLTAIVLVPGFVSAVWVAVHVRPDPVLHHAALFVHLACLVLGFGAVLAVDWVGLLWAMRRRTLDDVLATASNVHVPIWTGYGGLVASGAFLEPHLTDPVTVVKLATVVIIGWNGCFAMWLHRHLSCRNRAPGRWAMLASASAALVSQAGWWGATLIGFAAQT